MTTQEPLAPPPTSPRRASSRASLTSPSRLQRTGSPSPRPPINMASNLVSCHVTQLRRRQPARVRLAAPYAFLHPRALRRWVAAQHNSISLKSLPPAPQRHRAHTTTQHRRYRDPMTTGTNNHQAAQKAARERPPSQILAQLHRLEANNLRCSTTEAERAAEIAASMEAQRQRIAAHPPAPQRSTTPTEGEEVLVPTEEDERRVAQWLEGWRHEERVGVVAEGGYERPEVGVGPGRRCGKWGCTLWHKGRQDEAVHGAHGKGKGEGEGEW
ncbi:hypothetical protein EDC01DRAFT_778394 [Geopyxis carbonaria]|nr:hypothetical protein EDC01DRAFT_778394 [Geopyxis carbonaria]